MIDLTEYKEYYINNKEFLDMLKENESPVYDRLSDVIKVIGYIDMLIDKYTNIEEEYEVFFETGFPFLFNQLEEIKLYYNSYFNSDYEEFKHYEQIINYALYLDDLTETLKEEELMNPEIENAIKEVGERADLILSEKLNFDDNTFNEFNDILAYAIRFKRRIFTITEVFSKIVEELDI